MSTLHSSILDQAKAAFVSALQAVDTDFSADFKSVQIILEMEYIEQVNSRRIVIGAEAAPEVTANSVTGWEVELIIQVVTHFKKWTRAQHNDVCAPVEALIYDVAGLPAKLTNSSFKTLVVTPAPVKSDFQDEERITEYRVELNCLLTGV